MLASNARSVESKPLSSFQTLLATKSSSRGTPAVRTASPTPSSLS